jgi:hypothetical protein
LLPFTFFSLLFFRPLLPYSISLCWLFRSPCCILIFCFVSLCYVWFWFSVVIFCCPLSFLTPIPFVLVHSYSFSILFSSEIESCYLIFRSGLFYSTLFTSAVSCFVLLCSLPFCSVRLCCPLYDSLPSQFHFHFLYIFIFIFTCLSVFILFLFLLLLLFCLCLRSCFHLLPFSVLAFTFLHIFKLILIFEHDVSIWWILLKTDSDINSAFDSGSGYVLILTLILIFILIMIRK